MLSKIHELHIEVTRNCNLRCSYCYASQNITTKIIEEICVITAVSKIFAETMYSHIDIIFHGGEPLLAPVEWYESILPKIHQLAFKFDKVASFKLQTNATLVTREVINCLTKYSFHVSSSLDGPPEVNDVTRKNGVAAVAGILKLSDANLLDGIIATIAPENHQHISMTLEFLSQFKPNIMLNYVRRLGRYRDSESTLSADDIHLCRLKTMGVMRSHESFVDVNLARQLRCYLHPRTREDFKCLSCHTPFCHAGIHNIIVDMTGNIYPCGLSSNSEFCLGSIYDNELVHYKAVLETFHTGNKNFYVACKSCRAVSVCDFGCSIEGEIPEVQCAATQLLFDYFASCEPRSLKELMEYINRKHEQNVSRRATKAPA